MLHRSVSEVPVQRLTDLLTNITYVDIEPWSSSSKAVLSTTDNGRETKQSRRLVSALNNSQNSHQWCSYLSSTTRTPFNVAVTSEAPLQRFTDRSVNKTHVDGDPWSSSSKAVLRRTNNGHETKQSRSLVSAPNNSRNSLQCCSYLGSSS